jgi:BlaI family penicillinase repressor
VRRDRQQRPFLYAPAISRSRAAGQAVGDLVDRMFEGSAESLVLSMVRARQLTAEKLAELTALLEAAEDEEREGGDEG